MNKLNALYQLEFKEVSGEAGTFVGLASVPEVQDSVGDVIDKGAFKRTLRNRAKPVPLLWQHDTAKPIGIIDLKETDRGLEAVGHLNMDVALAREARALAMQGALNGLSIGFEIPKGKFTTVNGIRHIQEIKLWEVSMVTFPANQEALIEGVKSDEVDPVVIEAVAVASSTLTGPLADSQPILEDSDTCIFVEDDLTVSLEPLLLSIRSATSDLQNSASNPAELGHSHSSANAYTDEIRNLARNIRSAAQQVRGVTGE